VKAFPEVALCRRVGEELRGAVRDALAAIGAADLGTKALAERLGTTQVFTSRLRKLIASESGEEAVLSSPGVAPLRKLQLILVTDGLDGSAADRLLAAIVAFDRMLRLEIGDRRTLEALLIDFVPGGREAFESSRRQAAYRAFAEGRGVSARLLVDTSIVVPGPSEGRASLATVATLHGIERHAEGAAFGFDLQTVPLTGEGGQGASSRSADLAALDLQPYMDRPAAPTEVVSDGEGRRRLTLGETRIGPAGAVDLGFADLLEDAVPAGAPSLGDPRRFAITSGLACRDLVTEVLVLRGLFGGVHPELRHATTSGLGQVDVVHPEFPSLVRPIHQRLEPLDPSPRSLRVDGAAHRHELTVRVVELLGHRLDEFEVHRLTMPFPFPWSRFFHCWFHPDDPLRGVESPA
jgi:hypothetical protein